ncbi:TPA: DUF6387 family protein [Klebsiella quasipneumoniae]
MSDDVLKPFEWFNLEKYDETCKALSYGQWINTLWLRREYWGFDPLNPPATTEHKHQHSLESYTWRRNKREYANFIDAVTSGEILDIENIPHEADSGFDAIRKLDLEDLGFPTDESGVLHETPEGLITLSIPSDETDDVIIIDDDNDMSNSNIWVEIDLNAPDELIISKLRKILNNERKDIGVLPSKYISDGDIDKLVNLRVLPYIDLMIFSKINNIEMSHVLISRLLYPDEYEKNIVERVRKTMPKVANAFMDDRLLLASEYKYGLGL